MKRHILLISLLALAAVACRRAGFDFFPNVPADLQNAAESAATALWTY